MSTKMMAIKDLQVNLYVRQALDQDRVEFFVDLISSGVNVGAIKLANGNVVVDGRHRLEAHEVCDHTEVEIEDLGTMTEIELIAEAYRSNVGGSLPPSSADTEHTIMLLLERDEAKKRIGELLGLPASLARRYVNEVQAKLARAKLLHAAAAVTDGHMTVFKSAEEHGVDPDKLRDLLSGHKRKSKAGVAEIQRNLTKAYKAQASRNAALIRSLLDKCKDGDVSPKQVREIFAHIESLQKKAARATADWKKRHTAVFGKK